MKKIWLLLLTCGVCVTLTPLIAETGDGPDWLTEAEETETASASHEFKMSYSYAAPHDMEQGNFEFGELSDHAASASYIASVPLHDAVQFRVGPQWARHSFQTPSNSRVPNTLQSVALSLGVDVEVSENVIMRVEVQPGIYSDFHDVDFDHVNYPAIVGFSYLFDSNLQWFFGMSVDVNREIPVIPAAGVRWQFADDWTLMLLFPDPRIEYQVTNDLMLYAGGSLMGGTYRVGDDFGDSHNNPKLNGAIVEYQEIRAGIGAEYKINPAVALQLEAGAVVERSFNFERANTNMDSNEPAPYIEAGIRANF